MLRAEEFREVGAADGGGNLGDVETKTPGKEPGPLSRNGYFVLDDSGTAIWNANTDWPEPRPTSDGF
jgi:hypothetical protein